MKEALKTILDIQELDMKMIRLMRVKKERLKEIEHIEALRKELHEQLAVKDTEITDLIHISLPLNRRFKTLRKKSKNSNPSKTPLKK